MCQEPCELVHENVFNLVGLLYLNADAYTVDARLYKHPLVLVAGNREWCQQHLRGGLCFDFGDIMALGGLGCKVGETKSGCETAPDSLEIWPERLGLEKAGQWTAEQVWSNNKLYTHHLVCLGPVYPEAVPAMMWCCGGRQSLNWVVRFEA